MHIQILCPNNKQDVEWLEYVSSCIENGLTTDLTFLGLFSMSARQTNTSNLDTTAMIPMSCEDSKSAAMTKHSYEYSIFCK